MASLNFKNTNRPPWTAALKHSRSVMPARSERKLNYTQSLRRMQENDSENMGRYIDKKYHTAGDNTKYNGMLKMFSEKK